MSIDIHQVLCYAPSSQGATHPSLQLDYQLHVSLDHLLHMLTVISTYRILFRAFTEFPILKEMYKVK